MIIYYSKSGNTRMFAQTLSEMTGETLFELEEKAQSGLPKALFQSVFKKSSEALKLPSLSNETGITLCSPVWAASPAPVCTYFLANTDLRGKKVNMILTCAQSDGTKYSENARKSLSATGCEIGVIETFSVKSHAKMEKDSVKSLLEKFL